MGRRRSRSTKSRRGTRIRSRTTSLRRYPTSRRLKNVARNLLGATVYYGMMLSIGMIQSKSVLCRLCRTYLNQIGPIQFWLLFAGLTILFFLLDCVLVNVARKLMLSKYHVIKSQSLLYPDCKEGKCTRSGLIYGYM